ncbi:alpha/beta fold hydrolase [Polaromonas glacialis]|uniref:alpha/beta fold hydrolase n=1 Tax=Polaromonas glacialis TaxID=866564 RepID=UPI000495B1B8|nr:alpha/beta fold hydrolase [Polaromonas glacialis]
MPSTASLEICRPPLTLLATEPWRAALEFLSSRFSDVGQRKMVPAGDGHPVIIFPGLATDSSAIAPLRDYCESLGYSTLDWGRGFNTGPKGDLDRWLADLAAHTADLLGGHQGKATLIGWSLGGMYAREVGKLLAPQVRQVITIGTPFNAEADHTNVGWLFRLLSGTSAAIDPALSQRLRTPPPLPTTSIYSRSDGVVAWETCRHARPARQVQDIEIKGSHIGMGWNPAVLQIVGDRLGQHPANWQPYQHAA